MQKRREIVAWWLFVLLLRVLTPEAAIIRLHFHDHTDDAPALALAKKAGPKAVFSAKHQHCHVEQLYDAPFQPSLPMSVAEPVRLLMYAEYCPQALVCRALHLLDGASLRGPPAIRA